MERGSATAGVYGNMSIPRHQAYHQTHLQHGSCISSRPDTTIADARDQEQQELMHLSLDLPITYMPFKFENRRVRIDWRLLHGVDIDKLVRDTDLDTLEELVTCVTWGDIEAEDTRHLSEGNFVKVFRLAQLLLEYLLYVQENLKYTNGVLDKSRSAAVLHVQSLNSRYRDLYSQLKHCKRELKRVHKTVKTFELMAAAVGGAAAAAQAASAAAAASPVKQDAAQAGAQQPQQQQQQGSMMTAGEMLLQGQLSELTERLTLAVCEAERLRSERQELQYQIRHLHDTLAAKLGNSRAGGSSNGGGSSSRAAQDSSALEAATAAAVAASQQQQQQLFMAELQCAQAQINELQSENKELRHQLKQQSDAVASASAAESAVAALQAQLEEQAQELLRLQGEVRERESSIKVFQTSNTALQQQLEALQRQLASPEATTPSFVAKQRQQLAAAATAHAGLQADNTRLRQELLELRLALEAADTGKGTAAARAAAAAVAGGSSRDGEEEEEEEDALAAAERLLGGSSDTTGAAAVVSPDWKVQEIGRLQGENRQLQAKVASLQAALHDLECSNAQLERRLAAAQAAGFAASPQSSPKAAAAAAAPPAAAAAGANDSPESAGLGVAMGSGWASVSSSGPAAELTAADLATAGPGQPASAADSATAVDSVQQEQSLESVASDAAAAAAAATTANAAAAGAAAGTIVKAGREAGKAALPVVNLNLGNGSTQDSSGGGRIAAYRPSRDDTAGGMASPRTAAAHMAALSQQQQQQQQATATASDPTNQGSGVHSSSTAGPAGARGSIDQAAAQQLRSLVRALAAEVSPEQLEGEYAEVCCDWDKPFDLTEEEKQEFRQKVPLEVAGMQDVLCSQPHTAEELSAAKPRMLPGINRILDAQLASFGIHPGRTGLSNIELLAAMKMLSERRESFEAQLTPQQRQDVEVTRLGLLLHPYHALQATLTTLPDGPDGKKHLPEVSPALVSAVRPPASSLPPPPPPIRLQPRGPSPLGSPGGFGGPIGGLSGDSAAAAAAGLSPGANRATPSPAARYGVTSQNGYEMEDSEEGHSPVRHHPELGSVLGYRATSSTGGSVGGGGGLTHLRPPSPLGSEAAREAIAKATSSGSFSPMSAALHAKQQLLQHPLEAVAAAAGGPVSPGSMSTGRSVSPGLSSPMGGYTAGSVAAAGHSSLVQQQQVTVQVSPTGIAPVVSPGAARAVAATGQAVQQQQQQKAAQQGASVATKQYLTTFEDSDEF